MLVYADRWRQVAPSEQLRVLRRLLGANAPGRDRHDVLVRALIEAGELAQGLADAEFARLGCDDDTPVQAAALNLAIALARKVDASWRSGFASGGPDARRELAALEAMTLPGRIRCKTAEGYAHYAVYPEAFMAAAREIATAPLLVIGLRSIGASLGAAVAAATPVAQVVTLRPHGPPFERRVAVSDSLARRLGAHEGTFAVVDEGPGLSGSSFGAVGDLLAGLGVAAERVVYCPSHAGEPGPAAQVRHRQRWREAARVVKALDDLAPPAAVAGWFEDLTGEAGRVDDLSHGGWRDGLPAIGRPPVWAASERRKIRLTSGSGVFVARFAGLGREAAAKLDRAKALHAAGFGAEPLALRHGFLLERWLDGRALLRPPRDRPATLRRLGDYLSFRQHLPAEVSGAPVAALLEMGRVNAERLGGPDLADRVASRLAALEAIQLRLRPAAVDGRLHAWEWLRGCDGALRKTDALDHCCGHDLVGCQDIGWDLAGAAVEFDLTPDETRALERMVLGSPDAERVELFRGAYCAFQAGVWSMAAAGAEGADRERAARRRDAYAATLSGWADEHA